MSLPTLVKTYEFNVSSTIPGGVDYLEANRNLLFDIKERWKGNTGTYGAWTDATNTPLGGAPSGAWTVQSSSKGDGTFGAGDNIPANTNLVWQNPGVNHSWFVMEHSSGAQVCIDCRGTTYYYFDVVMFPNGLTVAGTATARPTATDEVVVIANGTPAGNGGPASNVQTILNFIMSTDGTVIFIDMWRSSGSCCWAMFQLPPGNPVAGSWTGNEMVGMWKGTTNSGTNDHTLQGMTQTPYMAASPNGTPAYHYLTTEAYWLVYVAAAMDVPNDGDSSYNFFPIGCYSNTVGARGRNFSLIDCWATQDVIAQGSTFPGTGTVKQFLKTGDWVIPWNQSVPVLA